MLDAFVREVARSAPLWLVEAGFIGLVMHLWRRHNVLMRAFVGNRGRVALGISTVTILFIAFYFEYLGPRLWIDRAATDTIQLIQHTRWIAYDPSAFNPSAEAIPTIESIGADLRLIQQSGFQGIVTFASTDALRMIPVLAKRSGLRTIVGVWNPRDPAELARALSVKDYADAYCIGHDGLDQDYSMADLTRALRLVRFRTKRPVSTTESLNRYVVDSDLHDSVDWLFPDVQSVFDERRIDPTRDAEAVLGLAEQLARENARHKPILLKMVLYPHAGTPGASEKQQEQFFHAILTGRKSRAGGLSFPVAVSFFGFLDTPWKDGWPYHRWEAFTGLFRSDGSERPALTTIRAYSDF